MDEAAPIHQAARVKIRVEDWERQVNPNAVPDDIERKFADFMGQKQDNLGGSAETTITPAERETHRILQAILDAIKEFKDLFEETV